jgi:thioredoxin-related protein
MRVDQRGKCVCFLSACIALVACLCLGCPACAYASDTLNFLEYQNALQKGKAFQRPLLIIFSTPWCYQCTELKRKILQNKDIVSTLNERFFLVEVDISQNNKLKDDFRVYFTPTIVFLDSHGKPIMDVKGFIPMNRFRELLRYISEGFYKTTGFAAFEKK